MTHTHTDTVLDTRWKRLTWDSGVEGSACGKKENPKLLTVAADRVMHDCFMIIVGTVSSEGKQSRTHTLIESQVNEMSMI